MNTLDFLSPISLAVAGAFVAVVAACFLVARLWIGPPAAHARRWGLWAIRGAVILLLIVLLANPVQVTQSPGALQRPDVFYLLDASQSMAMGEARATRWDRALQMIRDADEATRDGAAAKASLFRFGRRLASVGDVEQLRPHFSQAATVEGETNSLFSYVSLQSGTNNSQKSDDAKPLVDETNAQVGPTDPDTQMLVALRQISSRFGRSPPASIVVFSDGRAHDETGLEEIARFFQEAGVPVHVAPLGDTARGGDVALVAVVAPPRVRKQSQVEVQAFLRSYGYDGKTVAVRLESLDEEGRVERKLDERTLTLQSGFQPITLAFQSDLDTRRLQVTAAPQEKEISTENNSFRTEVEIDRTKIRVLYVEGAPAALTMVQQGDRYVYRGPFSDLQQALMEDPDIECVVVSASYGALRRIGEGGGLDATRGFPETVAELSAFDALVLSNVPRTAFTDQQIQWIEQWVARRGAGLCMVGGQFSFGSGGWDGDLLEQMLPVDVAGESDWNPSAQVAPQAVLASPPHPIWRIVLDDQLNRAIVGSFPEFRGVNEGLEAKTSLATVLASAEASTAAMPKGFFGNLGQFLAGGQQPQAAKTQSLPLLVAGRYGKGRTLTLATPITEPYANEFLNNWGSGGSQYYSKFWRNAVYWLTENSSIGRRRLITSADKQYYKPDETISIRALAYDEGASRTADYRIVAMVEPHASVLDLDSDYSPVRWPSGVPRTSGEEGPFLAWGEEFELPKSPGPDGQTGYAIDLPIAETLSSGASNQSLRLELTAYEDYTQVDSTSIDIQVLHDPFEQQNPFPNHELLHRLADVSGGRVIENADQLAQVLQEPPVTQGPPEVRKTPLWSNGWLLTLLVGLLTTEWLWRRGVGMA